MKDLTVEADVASFNKHYDSFILVIVEFYINLNSPFVLSVFKQNTVSLWDNCEFVFQIIQKLLPILGMTDKIYVVDPFLFESADRSTFFNFDFCQRLYVM